jgi:hypothetical protein
MTRQKIQIPNARQLEQAVASWRTLKENVVDCWPWSNGEQPPIDRDMIAASREALSRGEVEPIEDLVRRLGGNLMRG